MGAAYPRPHLSNLAIVRISSSLEVRLRALFTIYLAGIVIAITYFTVIGLTHH
jgi:hypothetical protein